LIPTADLDIPFWVASRIIPHLPIDAQRILHYLVGLVVNVTYGGTHG